METKTLKRFVELANKFAPELEVKLSHDDFLHSEGLKSEYKYGFSARFNSCFTITLLEYLKGLFDWEQVDEFGAAFSNKAEASWYHLMHTPIRDLTPELLIEGCIQIWEAMEAENG
jgi:hypothetical protein